jgi:hypothetical protein
MRISTAGRVIAFLLVAVGPGLARAAAVEAAGRSPTGKAVAHAALADQADIPATPPQLPLEASDRARDALGNAAFGKKGEAASQAHGEADRHANRDAIDAHATAADRAAQVSAAAAARSANADARAAAGQARVNAAKAAGHRRSTPAAAAVRQ